MMRRVNQGIRSLVALLLCVAMLLPLFPLSVEAAPMTTSATTPPTTG